MSFVPFYIALVAYYGTSSRALADRERLQQIRETVLYQLMYYVPTIIIDGRKDERSAKVNRKNAFLTESESERTAVRLSIGRFGERNALRHWFNMRMEGEETRI